MKVSEVFCKSALSYSRLPGLRYALNPYRGCQHSCLYCYAPYVLRERRPWGSFLDVKINIPTVLSKELKRKRRGTVGISTVTDPYQPLEKKYKLTRLCLEQLLKHDFPISIQTKSALVLRDLDLIKRFSSRDVGFTITTIDDEARKRYEPFASPVGERISALGEIADLGIKTWVFIGPIMPYITDRGNGLENLIKEISKADVGEIILDKLNMKPGLDLKLNEFYLRFYPDLLESYRSVDREYFEKVKSDIFSLCRKQGVRCSSAWYS
ncbi:MAG: radical SAM protein [Candidatus Hydrothermarchaeales archaeon]